MKKTPIQKQIENTVTNGISYREKSGYALRRIDDAPGHGMVGDTEVDLQMHLGGLDAITAERGFARDEIWEQVFALGEVASWLQTYELRENVQTPEDVSSLILGYYRRKSMGKAQHGRGLNPISNSSNEKFFYSPGKRERNADILMLCRASLLS